MVEVENTALMGVPSSLWTLQAEIEKMTGSIASKLGIKLTHPEMVEGEVHLCDVGSEAEWENIGWESRRRGKNSYNDDGSPKHGFTPVFISKKALVDQVSFVLAVTEGN